MATGGYFPSNKERTNYARLCRAIVDLCTEVLRKLLSSHVHPAQILNTAHRCPLHALDPVQWTTISDAKTKGYTDFDISLLCTLLRNTRGIRSPAAGWGGQNFPVPRAIDVADDIERIRLIRNEIGHSTDTLINDVKYQEIMTELQGIMNRFDSRLGAAWSLELTRIDTDDMDPENQTKYIDVIKDFEKSDRELKKEIETIKGDQINFKGKLDKVEEQTKVLGDGLYKQNTRFAEYEIQQREDQDNLKSRLGETEQQTKNLEDGLSKQASRMEELETKQRGDQINFTSKLDKVEEQTKVLGDGLYKQNTRFAEYEIQQREDQDNLKSRLGETEQQTKNLEDGLSKQASRMEELETKQRGDQINFKGKLDKVEEQTKVLGDGLYKQNTRFAEYEIQQREDQDNLKSRLGETEQQTKNLQDGLSKQASRMEELETKQRGKPVRTLVSVITHRKDKTFVSTKAVDKGFDVLMKQGMLIYTGIGGCGKTKNALEVMKRVQDSDSEYQLIEVNDISKWQEYVNPQVKSVVLLDDCLGKTNLNTSILHEGDKYFRQISDYVKLGKIIKVIMTIRKNILNQSLAQTEHHKIFTDEHIIDLSSSFKLEFEEKRRIIKRHCYNNNISICLLSAEENYTTADILNDKTPVRIYFRTVVDIIKTDPPTGFPQSCYLFASFRKYTRQGIKFFRNPIQILIEEIDRLRKLGSTSEEKLQHCVLSYMLLKGGEINMDSLDEQILNAVMKSIKLPEHITDDHLGDAVQCIKDKYIVNVSTDTYQFQHETILEAVALSFGKQNPRLLIQLCSEKFIKEFVRAKSYKEKEGEVILRLQEKYYVDLANRFSKSLEVNDSVLGDIELISDTWSWLSYPVLDDEEFVNSLMVTMKKNQRFKTFVNSKFNEFKKVFNYAFRYGNTLLLDKLYNEFLQSSENVEQNNDAGKILNQCLVYAICYNFVDKVMWLLDSTNIKIQKECMFESLTCANGPILTAMISHETLKFTDFIEAIEHTRKTIDSNILHVILNRWPNMEQEHLLKLIRCICKHGYISAMQVILNHPPIQLTNIVECLDDICRRRDGDIINILLRRWPNMEQEHLVKLLCYICKCGNNSSMQVMLKHSHIQLTNVVEYLDDIGRHGDGGTVKILLERWPNMEQELLAKLVCYICKYGNNSAMLVMVKHPLIQLTNVVECLDDIGRHGYGTTIKILLERWPNMEQQHLANLFSYICKYGNNPVMCVIIKHPLLQLTSVFQCLDDIGRRGDGTTVKILLERWPNMEQKHLAKLLCYICTYGNNSAMQVMLKHSPIQVTGVVEYLDEICRHGDDETIKSVLERWPNMEQEHLSKLFFYMCKYGNNSAMQVMLKHSHILLTNVVEYLDDIGRRGDGTAIKIMLERWPNMEQQHLANLFSYICKYVNNPVMCVMIKHPLLQLTSVFQCLDDIGCRGDGTTVKILLERWPNMEQENLAKLLCYICKYGNNSAMKVMLNHPPIQLTNVVECLDDIGRHGDDTTIKILLERWPNMEQENLAKLLCYICEYGNNTAMLVMLKHPLIQLTNVVECLDDIGRHGDVTTIKILLQRWPNMEQENLAKLLCYICEYGNNNTAMQVILKYPTIQLTNIVQCLDDICRRGDGSAMHILLERWPDMEQDYLAKLFCYICKDGFNYSIQAILKHPHIQLTNVFHCLEDICQRGHGGAVKILLERWPNMEQELLAKLFSYICKHGNNSAMLVMFKHPLIQLTNVVECLDDIGRHGYGTTIKILLQRWPNMEQENLAKLLCYICEYGNNTAMQVILKYPPIQLTNIVQCLDDICRRGDGTAMHILLERWPDMEQDYLAKLFCYICKDGFNYSIQAILKHPHIQLTNVFQCQDDICQRGDGGTVKILLERWPNMEQELLAKLFCYICKYGNNSAMLVMFKHPLIQLTNVVECLDDIGRHGYGTTIKILLEIWPNMEQEHLAKLFCYICKYGNNLVMQVMLKHPRIQLTNIIECLDNICRHGHGKTIEMLLARWPYIDQEHVVKLFHTICRIGDNIIISYILNKRPEIITQECITDALNWACAGGRERAIKCLLNISHNNINNTELHRLQNDENVTNLHLAAFYGRFNVLPHLLKTFTDLCVTQRTKSGISVLQMAMLGYVYNKYRHFADMCDYIGNIYPVLRKYFIEGSRSYPEYYILMLDYLIESRDITLADLDMKLDLYGNTLTHYCVIDIMGSDNSLIGLLSKKYSRSLCLPNNKGYKPIHVAAVLGRSDIFKLLYDIDIKQDISTSSSAESLENVAVHGQEQLGNKRIPLKCVIGFSIPGCDDLSRKILIDYDYSRGRNHDKIISIIKSKNS